MIKNRIVFLIALVVTCLYITIYLGFRIIASSGFKFESEYDVARKNSLLAKVVSPSINNQREPSIYGDWLVWSEKINGFWQIILFNLKNGSRQQLTSEPIDHINPSISSSVVVWWQGPPGGSNEVAGFNYSIGQYLMLPKTQATSPRAGDTGIAWIGEYDSKNPLIRPITYFDLKESKSLTLVQAYLPNWPSISGDNVVWVDSRNGKANIYAYSLTSKQEFAISTFDSSKDKPYVSGDIVVWQDNRRSKSLRDYDIYGYSLKAKREFMISSRGGNETSPKVSGNLVIWWDWVGGYEDIYAYNISSQTKITVAADQYKNGQPEISGTLVVWTRWYSNESDEPSQIVIAQVPAKP